MIHQLKLIYLRICVRTAKRKCSNKKHLVVYAWMCECVNVSVCVCAVLTVPIFIEFDTSERMHFIKNTPKPWQSISYAMYLYSFARSFANPNSFGTRVCVYRNNSILYDKCLVIAYNY